VQRRRCWLSKKIMKKMNNLTYKQCSHVHNASGRLFLSIYLNFCGVSSMGKHTFTT